MPTTRPPRAIITIGASAGGVEALSKALSAFPAAVPACLLVVLHVPPTGFSALPSILSRASHLPARHAADGDELKEGVVLIAPPDHHLLVEDGVARVTRAPHEHGHRPSVDVLMRSAADVYGTSCAGVVLSGFLDDGAAGIAAIKAAGGFTVVQDPGDAAFPDMPRAALHETEPDAVCAARRVFECLEPWLAQLEREPAPLRANSEVPGSAAPDPVGFGDDPEAQEEGPSEFTCPDCGGTLWASGEGGSKHFRCRVGHRYSESSLFLGKQRAIEGSIWAAIVALEERRDLSLRIATRVRRRGSLTDMAKRYEADATEAEHNLITLRSLFEELMRSPVIDTPGDGDERTGI